MLLTLESCHQFSQHRLEWAYVTALQCHGLDKMEGIAARG